MSRQNNMSEDKAKALLALGLTREQAEFLLPTDEELAMLAEDPSTKNIDVSRRAQIMDAVANDPETFSRWMQKLEMAQTLELGIHGAQVQDKPKVRQAPGIAERIAGFLRDHFKALTLSGGAGLAAAFAVVLMLPVGMDSRVAELYDGYGSTWDTRPEKLTMIRGSQDRQAQALDAENYSLREGVAKGLESLGPDFSIRKLNRDETKPETLLDPETIATLESIGRVATISYFKCSLGATDRYYTEAYGLLGSLTKDLGAAAPELQNAMQKALAKGRSEKLKVCETSELVIERVSLN